MLSKIVAVAWTMLMCAASVGVAQTDGPAELPAADYQGQSYVDSKGCIFLKAGYGGQSTWVPRVDQNRKPICGQTPTKDIAKVSDATAVDGQPVHLPRVKKHTTRAEPPPPPVLIGCPVSVPVARRYATTNGGSVVICTATNGSLTGARSPIYPAGSGVGAALSARRYSGVNIPLPNGRNAQNAADASALADAAPARAIIAAVPPAVPSIAAGGRSYFVQVGAFGEPANAQGAGARLKALGMPVSTQNISKHGRGLQVVYAGPFASGADAQVALTAARRDGFSDAYIR